VTTLLEYPKSSAALVGTDLATFFNMSWLKTKQLAIVLKTASLLGDTIKLRNDYHNYYRGNNCAKDHKIKQIM